MASQPNPNWELVSKEQMSHGMFYFGHAQETTVEFELPPEQIPGVENIAKKLAESTVQSIEENGGKVLTLEVYRDDAEWYNSRWIVKVNAHGSPLAWPFIVKGIIVLLGLLGLIILAHAILEVKDEWWFGPAVVIGGVGVVMVGGLLLVYSGGGSKSKTVYVQKQSKSKSKNKTNN